MLVQLQLSIPAHLSNLLAVLTTMYFSPLPSLSDLLWFGQTQSVRLCRSMLDGPTTPEARAMLIELALSIPARLSDLLVVLTSLMRPLVMALQEGEDLVNLGLRTLEYWVDR